MLSKISMGINLLLVAAVVILFIRTSNSKKDEPEVMPDPAGAVGSAFTDTASVKGSVIAFVNGDSIMNRYEFFLDVVKQMKKTASKSRTKIDQEIEAAQKEYDKALAYAQQKGENLSTEDQMLIQNQMMELEERIRTLQESEENELLDKEAAHNEELMRRITKFVSVYAKEHNIDIVLNYQELQQVMLYGDPPLDITTPVIDGLNAEYKIEKEQTKKQ